MSDRNPVDQASMSGDARTHGPVRVLAVTSGKGGVGKTNVSVNLALALADIGHQVLLMDADLGMSNVDVALGLYPTANLAHVIAGECTLQDIVLPGPAGIYVVPASSGIQQMVELGPEVLAGLIRAFSELDQDLDDLIIDTATGVNGSVVSFTRAAQEIIVVVCDEPASIADALAFIRLLNGKHGQQRFHILASMVRSAREGRDLYTKMLRATDRFLDVNLDYLGAIPYDMNMRRAVQKQSGVVSAYPRSRVAQAFRKLARNIDRWPIPSQPAGHLQFFVERIIQNSYRVAGGTR